MPPWLRKKTVAKREDCTPRTVENRVKVGLLPAPRYFPGSDIPHWDEDELKQNDKRRLRRTDSPESTTNTDQVNSA
jgi:hypothetical protein